MTPSEWSTESRGNTRTIGTPNGDYTPESDDLTRELHNAAVAKGYTSYRVFIDGAEVLNPDQLHTNSIAALQSQARIAPYDEGGK